MGWGHSFAHHHGCLQEGHSIVKNTGGAGSIIGVWDFGWERYFGFFKNIDLDNS